MTQQAATATLQQAVALHQAGRLAEAEQLYDRVLARDRGNADALNLKAVIADVHGRKDEALSLFDRAITARAAFPEAHFNRANTLGAMGRTEEALRGYARAIALRPAYADAHLNRAILLKTLHRLAEAVQGFREMARACPNDPRAHIGLANGLATSADESALVEAEAAYTRALALTPGDAGVEFSLANLLARRGKIGPAIEHVRKALATNPRWPEALSNLGEWLKLEGRYDEAVTAQRQAVTLRAGEPALQFNLADALAKASRADEARTLLEAIVAQRPDYVRARVNLGNLYKDQNRFSDALRAYESALRIDPTLHQAYANMGAVFAEQGLLALSLPLHDKAISMKSADGSVLFNLGIVSLELGWLAVGWPGYEERYNAPKEFLARKLTPPPYWDGSDLCGKSIAIWTEQGIGDEIIHASMLREIAARARQCLLACSARMAPVFARSFPEIDVRGYDLQSERVEGIADFDFQISLASLGQFLRRDFSSFPKHAGYLKANPARVAALRQRYRAVARDKPIVGLSWRSNASRASAAKSLALSDLAPLLKMPNVTFVNLQYGDCREELAQTRQELGVDIIHDAEVDPLADMDSFFAQVAAMDLVISTSNTTVHTAGSQNVPVWVLLPFAKGVLWYWFTKRGDSPWYPSARLIRAANPLEGDTDWKAVAAGIAPDFAAWVRQHRGAR